MGEEIHMEISIPTDDDGYALLQCEHCSNFFKAIPSDIEDDGILDLFCPACYNYKGPESAGNSCTVQRLIPKLQ
jgi:hypothetical protein